ncbi:hypothetical protein [Paenibacillus sp. FSL R7-0652]|jgi:uncharacterized protein YcfL|uniref:Lipoprotein n=1 Tax=Paenibacillus sp. AN1007 TaxID=3151385 RepID=A0AAU8NF02_9BACL
MSFKKYLVGVLALFLLAGCSLPNPNPDSASIVEDGSSTMNTRPDPFKVMLLLPQTAKVNEPFSIQASLKNESMTSIPISSRVQLFTYVIEDENRRQINSMAVNDGGLNRILKERTNITEDYTYKIKKSGTYYISAVAEFTITDDQDGDTNKKMKIIETKKLQVKDS